MSNSTLKGSTLVTFIIGLIVLIAIVLLFGSCDSPSARHARELRANRAWMTNKAVHTVSAKRGTIVLKIDTVQVISLDKTDTVTIVVGPHTYDVYSTEDYTVTDKTK